MSEDKLEDGVVERLTGKVAWANEMGRSIDHFSVKDIEALLRTQADMVKRIGAFVSAMIAIADFVPSEKVDDPPHMQVAVFAKKTARTMLRATLKDNKDKGKG